MNRIKTALQQNQQTGRKVLSVYFTAGFPNLEDTTTIVQELEKSGVGLIEIGMPFSDPLADGPVIQESSVKAIENGMNLTVLFDQLKNIRESVSIPLVLMGYWNPILQFGVEAFCERCSAVGIDGVIIPDLPPQEFERNYKPLFDSFALSNVLLITTQTSAERVQYLDSLSDGFLYVVSQSGVTGSKGKLAKSTVESLQSVSGLKLKNPTVVGFGIHDKNTFEQATQFHTGAIIGSAFIRMLARDGVDGIGNFIGEIRS